MLPRRVVLVTLIEIGVLFVSLALQVALAGVMGLFTIWSIAVPLGVLAVAVALSWVLPRLPASRARPRTRNERTSAPSLMSFPSSVPGEGELFWRKKTVNQSSRLPWRQLVLLALGAAAFLLLLMQLKSAANLYDEGLVLVNAERIRAGEIPYRDFWTLYAPGYFYALAALFTVVEPTILAARWFDIVLRFGLVIAAYGLARGMTSRWAALAPAALITYWLATIRFYSYPAFPATGAILLAALALMRYLHVRRGRWLFVSGLALGLTAILRLDFGGYAAVGFAAAVALDAWRVAAETGRDNAEHADDAGSSQDLSSPRLQSRSDRQRGRWRSWPAARC